MARLAVKPCCAGSNPEPPKTRRDKPLQDLLTLPQVQSAVLPLLIAVIAGLLLRPLGWFWSGLAPAVAFFLSAALIEGIQFSPLTSTRKLLLIGLLAVFAGIVIDALRPARVSVSALLAILAAAAGIWLIWPVLQRQQGQPLWLMAGATVLYMGWLGGWTGSLYGTTLRAASTAWILALATGVTAFAGASAKLGQLGLALAAAAAAFCLLHIISEKFRGGALYCVPALMIAGLLGVSGAVYAKVSWYSLIPLAVMPAVAAVIRLNRQRSRLVQAVLLTCVLLPLAIIAIVITRQLGVSDSPYY
jgi:hypothetical protein